jgi:hypothetical protein
LAALKSLESLNLADTQVTDTGLKELAGLTSLQELDLTRVQITDGGLRELAGLKSLKTLDLTGTGVKGQKPGEDLDLRFLVTDTGIAELRKALPELNIIR